MNQILDPRYIVAHSANDDATTGRQTLGEIERTIEDLRAKERAIRSELETITTTRSKLIEQRLAAYRELAEVRTRNAIWRTASSTKLTVCHHASKNLLVARQHTVDGLKQRQVKADETRTTLTRARDALADRIENLEILLDKLALEAREALAPNTDYRSELAELERAATTLTKAADKSARAEQDRVEKGRRLTRQILFSCTSGAVTLAPTHTSPQALTRWLDGLVANHIEYRGARANYAILTEIPIRLREHVRMLEVDRTAKQKVVDARRNRNDPATCPSRHPRPVARSPHCRSSKPTSLRPNRCRTLRYW